MCARQKKKRWPFRKTDNFVDKQRRRQQCGLTVAFAVVRHGLRTSLFHRQTRLRAVQRLHLAFLVGPRSQRLIMRCV